MEAPSDRDFKLWRGSTLLATAAMPHGVVDHSADKAYLQKGSCCFPCTTLVRFKRVIAATLLAQVGRGADYGMVSVVVRASCLTDQQVYWGIELGPL